jgi:hypothetical protein
VSSESQTFFKQLYFFNDFDSYSNSSLSS